VCVLPTHRIITCVAGASEMILGRGPPTLDRDDCTRLREEVSTWDRHCRVVRAALPRGADNVELRSLLF
jgi:hypothetical protein